MGKIVDLIGNVILAAPSLPEPLAASKYLDAARKFFFATRVWRTEVAVARYASTAEYLLIPDAGTEVFDLVEVLFDGYPLSKATKVQMNRYTEPGHTGAPKYFRIESGRLHLARDPGEDVAKRLAATGVLRPSVGVASIDDAKAEEFGEALDYGTLARVLAIPGQPWTDYDQAKFNMALFLSEIEDHRWRSADEGMLGVPRAVRYGGL